VEPPHGELHLVDSVAGCVDRTICRTHYRRSKHRVVVSAALELAALVAATSDPGWRAITVERGKEPGSHPVCQQLTVAGGVDAARSLLEAAAELRVAALRGAVPLFETASKVLYDTGALDEDQLFGNDFFGGDMSDDHTRFVWGSATLTEIEALRPSPATLASMLWGSVARFVDVSSVSRPRKRAAS
jgi:hypothetical protein